MTKIGLVACSKTKLSVPAPAYLLYSKSPKFTQCYLVAKRDCDKVFILSAKHGAVEPSKVLAPYNTYLADMPPEYIEQWGAQVWATIADPEATYYSYLPSAYRQPLEQYTDFEFTLTGTFFQTAKKLGKTKGNLLGCQGIMTWCLEYVYLNKVVSLAHLEDRFTERGYPRSTINAQLSRLPRHPLLICKGNFVRYRYLCPNPP
jgi:hypothetical protein